jgi:hypothetical protein
MKLVLKADLYTVLLNAGHEKEMSGAIELDMDILLPFYLLSLLSLFFLSSFPLLSLFFPSSFPLLSLFFPSSFPPLSLFFLLLPAYSVCLPLVSRA